MSKVATVKTWLCFLIASTLLTNCSTLPTINQSGRKSDLYLRGVFHVHSNHSHDSSGSVQKIKQSAKKLGLDFIVITDHNNLDAKKEIESNHHLNDPLLIVGNEISTTDGHLISLGTDFLVNTPVEPQRAINLIREHGGFSVIAHPVCDRTAWKDWSVTDFDGIEIYNYACDFYSANKFSFFLKSLFLPPASFIKHTLREPRFALDKWDSLLSGQALPAFAAADAHQNYGFGGFYLTRFDLSFRAATLYVQKSPLDEKEVLQNLFSGHGFIVFESLGRVENFTFEARSSETVSPMGGTIRAETPVSFFASIDRPAEIHLLRDGKVIRSVKGKSLTLDVRDHGIYRVEVFLNGRLWIVSNPISYHG